MCKYLLKIFVTLCQEFSQREINFIRNPSNNKCTFTLYFCLNNNNIKVKNKQKSEWTSPLYRLLILYRNSRDPEPAMQGNTKQI